jgi:hypothetical protein
MSKINYLIILLLAFFVQLSLSQNKETTQAAEKAAFLAKAPTRVQEYYRAFDSLANQTSNIKPREKWSISELKKYASLICAANEFDWHSKRKYNIQRNKAAKEANNRNAITDIDVIKAVRERVSEKHASVIENPFWFTITVENIESIPYGDSKDGIIEKRIHGRIKKVWKGVGYSVNDVFKCYYLNAWGYKGLVKGNSYIVAVYPLVEIEATDYVMNALGGPYCVQQSVFPIENGYVVDADNVFQLGNKVELNKFTGEIESVITQIKSWNGGK